MSSNDSIPPGGVFPQISALLEMATQLTPEQLDQLSAAWEAGRPPTGVSVQGAAFMAALTAADEANIRDLFEATWDKSWNCARDRVAEIARDAHQAVAWDGARAAIRDAALALLMRDKINPIRFDTLVDAWVTVMGRTWESGRQ